MAWPRRPLSIKVLHVRALCVCVCVLCLRADLLPSPKQDETRTPHQSKTQQRHVRSTRKLAMLLRVRISSFLAGFGVCSAFALYQLRQDVVKSNSAIIKQVGGSLLRGAAQIAPAQCVRAVAAIQVIQAVA